MLVLKFIAAMGVMTVGNLKNQLHTGWSRSFSDLRFIFHSLFSLANILHNGEQKLELFDSLYYVGM